MRSVKAWIAVAVVVLAVGAGAIFAITSGGGDKKPATTPTSVPAAAAAVQPTDAAAQQMVGNLLNEIAQATNNAGQPQVITKEQAEALLRQQLQQLGVPPTK